MVRRLDAARETAPANDRRPRAPQKRERPRGGGYKRERTARPAKPKFKPRPASRPKSKPPQVPLTTEMKAGKEPLRTFGELKQFIDLKSQDEGSEDQPEAEGS